MITPPEYDQPKFSVKDMWWANTKVAIATFVIAGIYFQFVQVRDLQTVEHATMKERTEYINKRIDTKHEQQGIYVKEFKKEQIAENTKIWSMLNKLMATHPTESE